MAVFGAVNFARHPIIAHMYTVAHVYMGGGQQLRWSHAGPAEASLPGTVALESSWRVVSHPKRTPT